MATVYQTLDGIFYVSLDRTSYLEIDRSKLPELPLYTSDGHDREYSYTFDNKTLKYGDNDSIFEYMAECISQLLEGTYLGEVTVVNNDFFSEWHTK